MDRKTVASSIRDAGRSPETRCTCFLLRRLTRRVTQLYDHHLQESGLKTTQYSLLSRLRIEGPLPMRTLAEHLGMDRSTLTRNVQPLIAAGCVVQRRPDRDTEPSHDPRAVLLELTAEGIEKLRKARPLWQRAQQQMGERLGSAALTELHSMIDTAFDRLPMEAPA